MAVLRVFSFIGAIIFALSGNSAVAQNIGPGPQPSPSANTNNIVTFGADPTGTIDSQSAIAAAITNAAGTGKSITIPCGTFLHSGEVALTSVSAVGFGPCSILKSTDTTSTNPQLAIKLSGNNASLASVQLTTTWSGSRQQNNDSSAVYIASGSTNFSVEHIIVQGAGSAGIFTQGGSFGLIDNNYVSSTLADCVHTTGTSSYIEIVNNKCSAPGDDCIAVVSYNSDSGLTHDIHESGNQCINGATRGFTVVGGNNITIDGGNIQNVFSAAIYIASEVSFNTREPSYVTVRGVTEDGCGVTGGTTLACNFIAGRVGDIANHITLSGIVAKNVNFMGVQVGIGSAGGTSEVTIADSHFFGIGGSISGSGAYANGVSNLDIHDTTFANFSQYAFVTDATSFDTGYLKFDNNHAFQTDTSAVADDVVHVFGSGFTSVQITGLTQKNGTTTSTRLITNDVVNSVVMNNTGDNTSINTPGFFIPYAGLTFLPFTVSTLPSGLVRGSVRYVTDATACTFGGSLTGGGTTFCPVIYNGTTWQAGG